MDDTKRDLELDMERAIGACQAMARCALEILEATDNPLSLLRHAEHLMGEAAAAMSKATTKRYRLDALIREETDASEP